MPQTTNWKFICDFLLLFINTETLFEHRQIFKDNGCWDYMKYEIKIRALTEEHPLGVCECPRCLEFMKGE